MRKILKNPVLWFFIYALVGGILIARWQLASAASFGQGVASVQSQNYDSTNRREFFQPMPSSTLSNLSTSSPITLTYQVDSGGSLATIGTQVSFRYWNKTYSTELWCQDGGGTIYHVGPLAPTAYNTSTSYDNATGLVSIQIATSSPIMACINYDSIHGGLTTLDFADGTYNTQHLWGTSASTVYDTSTALNWGAWYFGSGADTNIKSASFQFSGSYITPPSPSISLEYPTSTTPDFTNWVVDFQNATSGIIGVRYNQTGATTTIPYSFYDDSTSFSPFINALPYVIHKSQPLWYPPLSPTQTWYATPYFIPNGTTTATFGSKIQFTVNASLAAPSSTTITDAAGPFSPLTNNFPTSTATSTNFTMTCDPSSGLFSVSLCYLFQASFVPSQDSLNLWVGLKNDLSTKPPFGYLSSFAGAIMNINTSTSSPYTLPDLSTVPLFSSMRSFIKTLLYLGFAFWIVYKIRNLQL